MRSKGTITSWNDDKGFGFITPAAGGKQIFVHVRAFGSRNRRPELNRVVTYAVSTDMQGRPCAVQVSLPGERLARVAKPGAGALSIIAAVVFLCMVGACVSASRIPLLVLDVYVVASLLTLIVYALDKSAAQNGSRRTPENTLHMLALAGGWPGAIVAQQALRHKSSKQSFRTVFWVTVLLNCGAFVWLLTAGGGATLRSWLSAA
jgi:uncharacterized membrane protein YsdA (DUF1294 family)/cold shock CspA family protein